MQSNEIATYREALTSDLMISSVFVPNKCYFMFKRWLIHVSNVKFIIIFFNMTKYSTKKCVLGWPAKCELGAEKGLPHPIREDVKKIRNEKKSVAKKCWFFLNYCQSINLYIVKRRIRKNRHNLHLHLQWTFLSMTHHVGFFVYKNPFSAGTSWGGGGVRAKTLDFYLTLRLSGHRRVRVRPQDQGCPQPAQGRVDTYR